jgi:hypothetical protein
MEHNGFSIQKTAKVLGCSTGAVQNWKRSGAPQYILMACQCHSQGLPPWGSLNDLTPATGDPERL